MGSSSNSGVYEPPLAAQSLSATSEMISSPLDATTAECTVAEKMVAYAHPPLPTATGHVTRHVKVKPLYPAREPFRRVRGDQIPRLRARCLLKPPHFQTTAERAPIPSRSPISISVRGLIARLALIIVQQVDPLLRQVVSHCSVFTTK